MVSRTPAYVAAVALAIPVVLPLLVFTYARRAPELAGIPFFFWYQFLLVFVSVAGTTTAFAMVRRAERDRRAAERRPGSRREGGAA